MEEATVQFAKPTETQIRRMKREELITLANKHEIQITQSESVRRLKNLITEHLYADDDEEEEEEEEVEESGDCNDEGSRHSSAGSMNIELKKYTLKLATAAQERREKEEHDLAAQE